MALILELQSDAMDANVPASHLVRRAYVAARKLGLSEFEEWLKNEHKGYPDGIAIPNYRTVAVHDWMAPTHRGLKLIHFAKPETRAYFAQSPITGSIGWVEEMLAGDTIVVKLPPQFIDAMGVGYDGFTDYYNMQGQVNKGSLGRVPEAVRNIILDWSLELEAQGVLGHGISFSEKEREAASQIPFNLTLRDIRDSQLQFYSPNAEQTMGLDAAAITALSDVVAALSSATENATGLDEGIHSELLAEIATLKAQASSPSPKRRVIVETLSSVRNILENAAGGVLAPEILALVTDLAQKIAG